MPHTNTPETSVPPHQKLTRAVLTAACAVGAVCTFAQLHESNGDITAEHGQPAPSVFDTLHDAFPRKGHMSNHSDAIWARTFFVDKNGRHTNEQTENAVAATLAMVAGALALRRLKPASKKSAE